jgi:fucose permease
MAEFFSLEKIGIGFLASAQYVGIILMPALIGRIADRVGKKRMLVVFIPVFSIGTLLVGVSSWLGITVLGLLFIGSGYGVAESVSTALLGDHYKENADRYINISQAFLCIGAVTAPLVSSLQGFHWRWIVYISSVVCLISLVLLLLETGFAKVVNTSDALLFDRSLIQSTPFRLFFITMLLYVGMENGFGYVAETYFFNSFRSSWGAYAVSLYWSAMALSRLLSSTVSSNLYVQLKIRFTAITLVYIVLALSTSPVLSLILCALIGFSFGPIWSFIMALAIRNYPEKTASVTGLISSGCGLGGVLFPILMQMAPLGKGFVLLAAAALAGCVCIVFAARQGRAMLYNAKN